MSLASFLLFFLLNQPQPSLLVRLRHDLSQDGLEICAVMDFENAEDPSLCLIEQRLVLGFWVC